MQNLEDRITAIENRNAHVEAEKAWETSWTRRIILMTTTYVTACLFLMATGSDHGRALLPAFVPSFAYLISTLSIGPLKKWWIHREK